MEAAEKYGGFFRWYLSEDAVAWSWLFEGVFSAGVL